MRGDVVPHTIVQSLRLRVREFEVRPAKRLLQQYLPTAELAAAPSGTFATISARSGRSIVIILRQMHLRKIGFASKSARSKILSGQTELLDRLERGLA